MCIHTCPCLLPWRRKIIRYENEHRLGTGASPLAPLAESECQRQPQFTLSSFPSTVWSCHSQSPWSTHHLWDPVQTVRRGWRAFPISLQLPSPVSCRPPTPSFFSLHSGIFTLQNPKMLWQIPQESHVSTRLHLCPHCFFRQECCWKLREIINWKNHKDVTLLWSLEPNTNTGDFCIFPFK